MICKLGCRACHRIALGMGDAAAQQPTLRRFNPSGTSLALVRYPAAPAAGLCRSVSSAATRKPLHHSLPVGWAPSRSLHGAMGQGL